MRDELTAVGFYKLCVIEKVPEEKVFASPLTFMRSPWSLHQSSPPRTEHCRAKRLDLLSRLAQ